MCCGCRARLLPDLQKAPVRAGLAPSATDTSGSRDTQTKPDYLAVSRGVQRLFGCQSFAEVDGGHVHLHCP